jgi:release factor glutamine methyltransferase
MADSQAWTVGRLLAWTTEYLKQHSSDSPRLDAEVLLAHALSCRRIDLYTGFEEIPNPQQLDAFRQLVRRRAQGTPVAYLVGRREFYSLSFRVTPDVLIPRPETELVVLRLVELAARHVPQQPPLAVADVGTGSGILAVCAARFVDQARVVAIDLSPPALAVARENARELGVGDRITFVQGDLLEALPAGQRFDFIVANPPYVATAEMAALARDVRDHEPRSALEAGPRGTEIIERLLPQAAGRLWTGGWLLIEISPAIAKNVERLVATEKLLQWHPVLKDSSGRPRVVQACKRPDG